jgi:O-antigen ligase
MISPSPEQSPASNPGLFSFSAAAGGNRFRKIALILLFLTSFAEISRVLDFRPTRIIFGLIALLAISLLASGRVLVFWKCGAGRALPFFVGWVLLSYLMSEHTEMSSHLVENVFIGAILFLAAAAIPVSVSEFKKMFQVIAAAGLLLCVLSLLRHGYKEGRLVSLWGRNSADPNYFAMALLGVAPIICVSFAAKPLWVRLCARLATALPLLLALRTLSRGGFLAMFAMLVVIFFLCSFKTRIVIACVTTLTLVVVLAFLPDAMRNRLASAARIPGSQSTANADSVSVDSRTTLLETSIKFTLAYPVAGVGPGNFGPTLAEFGRLQGFQWLDLGTHNSYTQLSSETGIPGVLLYLVLIFFTLKSVVKVLRQTSPRGAYPDPDLHRLSAGLLVSVIGTCTCMFFLSEGYGAINLFWFGLANGLRLLLPEDPKDETELVELEGSGFAQ